MAYKQNKLAMMSAGVIGQLNTFNYVSDDDAYAVIIADDYISDAQDNGMRVGDVVYVNDSTGLTAQYQCTALNATGGATLAALS